MGTRGDDRADDEIEYLSPDGASFDEPDGSDALEGGDIDHEDTDEAPRQTQRPKRLDRVRTSVQSANIEPGRADFSTKWAIDRLDEREKRFSFAAAGGAILFSTIIYLAESSNPNFQPQKGQLHPLSLLIVGIVAGALLVATTILGRRAPVGFVALITGAAFNSFSFFFLGLPFFALAVWILYRSYKIQRETAANMRAAARGDGTTSRSRNGSRPASAAASAKGPSSKGPSSKGPARPTGNKRYTPKRPPPPPPKPSRKERKAASKADS